MVFQQALNTKPDYQVAIEVQSFESVPGEAATVNALWTVRRVKDGKTDTGRTSDREVTTQKGYDALVAAHSRAVARMSQDIADSSTGARSRLALGRSLRTALSRPASAGLTAFGAVIRREHARCAYSLICARA